MEKSDKCIINKLWTNLQWFFEQVQWDDWGRIRGGGNDPCHTLLFSGVLYKQQVRRKKEESAPGKKYQVSTNLSGTNVNSMCTWCDWLILDGICTYVCIQKFGSKEKEGNRFHNANQEICWTLSACDLSFLWISVDQLRLGQQCCCHSPWQGQCWYLLSSLCLQGGWNILRKMCSWASKTTCPTVVPVRCLSGEVFNCWSSALPPEQIFRKQLGWGCDMGTSSPFWIILTVGKQELWANMMGTGGLFNMYSPGGGRWRITLWPPGQWCCILSHIWH